MPLTTEQSPVIPRCPKAYNLVSDGGGLIECSRSKELTHEQARIDDLLSSV